MAAFRSGTRTRHDEDREQLMSRRTIVALILAALAVVLPARAQAQSTGGMSYSRPSHGGTTAQAQASDGTPAPPATSAAPSSTTVPATTPRVTAAAAVGPDGLAIVPAGSPPQVAALIAAGNRIAKLPYKYGGGHGAFDATAYDCSGSVSFALHGAGLLDATLDSSALARWGEAGPGTWLSVFANKTHTYLIVAGLRFDTSGRRQAGSRWQGAPRSARGFQIRHPSGL
jgi:cell wall-associated NlpC family hydrolase